MPTAKKRVDELRQVLVHHNRKYYVDAQPEISDRDYDRLMDELKQLEKAHPDLAIPDSPTQRVGGEPIEGFDTVRHRVPMLSIDNTYSADDLREFDRRVHKILGNEEVTYVVELKIDGVAISLIYENGVFALGATRGDGDEGDDVTHNLKTVRDLPLRLTAKAPPPVFEARGEIYMTREDLVRTNEQRKRDGLEPYANPRNLSAGSLKLLDPKLCAQRRLRLFAYGTGVIEGLDIRTHLDLLEALRSFGFPVNPHVQSFTSIDAVIDYCATWEKKLGDLPYETDGLVIKVDDFVQREKLGYTSKAPRWVVAYKFEQEQAITRVNDIRVHVGKNGTLTPVAFLEMVQLAGTRVSHASLHNAEYIKTKDVRIGDMVVVIKAGKIIPYVLRSEHGLRNGSEVVFEFPTTCPNCGSPVEVDKNGVFYRCTGGTKCTGQIKEVLRSFARRSAMDIEGLGEKIIDQLVETGLVNSIPDVFRLTIDDLVELERMGKKSAQNLLDGIAASKERGLGHLLAGLAIPHVGDTVSHLLAQEFGNIDGVMAASTERLSQINGIGPILAETIYDYFQSEHGKETVKDLRELGVKLTEEVRAKKAEAAGAEFRGKSIVVTGTLKNYQREEMEALIRDHGGKAAGSVSKSTAFVVAGEKAGSKLDKAKALGVKIITEGEFEKLIGK